MSPRPPLALVLGLSAALVVAAGVVLGSIPRGGMALVTAMAPRPTRPAWTFTVPRYVRRPAAKTAAARPGTKPTPAATAANSRTPAQTVAAAPAPTPARPAQAKPAATAPAPIQPAAAATPSAAAAAVTAQAPAVLIASPAPGSAYHSSVVLEGKITDASGSGRQVASAMWEITGTDRSGSVPVSASGDFRVKLPTAGLQAGISIVVRAQTKSGGSAETTLSLIDSGEAPQLALISPPDDATFASTVKVAGTVSGPADAPDPLAEVDSLSWSVTGTTLGAKLGVSKDGSFSFSFSTVGLRGTVPLQVQAVDRNGHRATVQRVLKDRPSGPPLRVDTPASGDTYADSLPVAGRVGDPADPSAAPSEVKSLGWRVLGSASRSGTVNVQKDGGFAFTVPTTGLTGPQVVELRAEDLNGRVTVKALAVSPTPAAPPAAALPATTVAPATNAAAAAPATPAPTASIATTTAAPPAPATPAPTASTATAPAPATPASTASTATSSAPASAAPAAAPAVAPRLAISSPPDSSSYRSSVTVTGTVDQAASVTWSLAGSTLGGTVDVSPDGSFSFPVRTAGLRGTQALTIHAAAKSGLATDRLLVLLDDGTGLPIRVTSPADGGYYRIATTVEGSVGDPASIKELKSFAWDLPGHPELAGRIQADATGAFRFAIPFSQMTGDVVIHLSSEDLNGHVEEERVTLHDGTLKPVVALTAPARGAPYGSVIRLAGTVTDPYLGQKGMEGIDTLTWLVSPVDFSRTTSPQRGTAAVGPGGSFRIAVPAAGLTGAQDITLTAVGKSGNRGDVTVRIPQGTSDLPSLAVTPEDGRVTLRWDNVPFATRYDVAWTAGTGDPEAGTVRQGVASPVALTGLSNGALYTVRVKISFDDGGTGTSSLQQVIPLTPRALVPTVTGDYQQIKLAWDTVPGAAAYDVWRSTSSAGGFTRVAQALPTALYVDTAVEFGRDYWYSIAPAGPIAPLSAPASGRSLAFPAEKLAAQGSAVVSQARRVHVDGGYAFVAAGAAGLRIVDVANPASPAPVGLVPADDAWGVAIRGSYAYVADGASGLRVVDLSAPRVPVLLGQRKTSDARAVVLAGNDAWVADGDKGLKVIDITDAVALPRVGLLETVNAQDVAIAGTWLFVADGTGGLKVVDTRKPTAPVVAAALATTDARGIALAPGLALVADGAAGLRIIDISNPLKPVLLSTFTGMEATGVAAAGGFAYVTDPGLGVRVVDLQDPVHPTLFTAHDQKGISGVDVLNGYAYMTDGAGLDIMRVQIQGRSFRVASAATGGKAYAVTVSGPWAYVAGHSGGVTVVDASDPSHIAAASVTASLATRFAVSVSVKDSLAFVADGPNGLRILDVSPAWDKATPKPPAPLGAYQPGGTVNKVVPAGSLAYVAAGDQGVRVLDVTAPATPQETAVIPTTNASDILVRDGWAWVADGDGGVRTLDLALPAKPKLLDAVVQGNARSLALSGSLLFAAGASGVSIIDVTDPRAPLVKGRYDTRSAQGLDAAGSYLYVAEGYRGLTVLDVSRPSRPAVVSSCEDVFAVDVAVSGPYALVTDSIGLKVVQVLIPDWLKH